MDAEIFVIALAIVGFTIVAAIKGCDPSPHDPPSQPAPIVSCATDTFDCEQCRKAALAAMMWRLETSQGSQAGWAELQARIEDLIRLKCVSEELEDQPEKGN